jgi:hypothetical protein
MTPPSYCLNDTERDQMQRDGYVLRESVFTAAEVAAAIDACEEVVSRVSKGRTAKRYHVGSYTFDPDLLQGVFIKWEGDTDVVHGIEPCAHLSPELDAFAYDARFVDPAKAFVDDDDPKLWTEKINLKRPKHGGLNPFHQDFPYWQGEADDATRIVTAMVFLDDATLENGTLEVLPGSHLDGMRDTWTDKDAFGNLEIDHTKLPTTETVALEVAAGSVVWFGPFLVHKSGANTSTKQRRSLLYSYQPAAFTHQRDKSAYVGKNNNA